MLYEGLHHLLVLVGSICHVLTCVEGGVDDFERAVLQAE